MEFLFFKCVCKKMIMQYNQFLLPTDVLHLFMQPISSDILV